MGKGISPQEKIIFTGGAKYHPERGFVWCFFPQGRIFFPRGIFFKDLFSRIFFQDFFQGFFQGFFTGFFQGFFARIFAIDPTIQNIILPQIGLAQELYRKSKSITLRPNEIEKHNFATKRSGQPLRFRAGRRHRSPHALCVFCDILFDEQ